LRRCARAAEIAGDIRRAEDLSTEHRNKIQRSLHLMSQAELDIMKQHQVVHDLKTSQLSLNDSVTRRTAEIEILKTKVHTISGILGMGHMAYRKQTDQLLDLRTELERDVDRQRGLLMRVSHRRALMLEQIRIQKSLIKESGKCRALEDELEKPLNVHRWRFLDGTNPELAQLVWMNHELRDRLMLKITVLQRLRGARDKLQDGAKVMDTHLARNYQGNIQEEFDFLSNLLREKGRQLAMIEGKIADQSDTVSEHKDQVRTVRSLIRSEREGYFGAKKKVNEWRMTKLRERSQQDEVELANALNQQRYIGGGFAVAGVIRPDLDGPTVTRQPLAPIIKAPSRSALAMAQIVHPNSASLQVKMVPRGWNPQRGPLKPILPTVSGS
jgi:hypothetical protein